MSFASWYVNVVIGIRNGAHIGLSILSWLNPLKWFLLIAREASQLFLIILFPRKMLGMDDIELEYEN
jgi:hypothetical protein